MSRPILLALTLMAASTALFSSWFSVWVVIELLLVVFLSASAMTTEVKLKYFIIQTISGLGWLLAISTPQVMTALFLVMVLLKLGLFPFFFWVPVIYSGSGTQSILILSTVMKLPGIILMSHMSSQLTLLLMLLSVALGSVGGWGTTHFKKLLGWSSVTHTSWVCILMTYPAWALLYFTLYASTLASFIYILSCSPITSPNQLLFSGPTIYVAYSITWMSLAGLPPLLGFVLKWISVEVLMMTSGLLIPIYIMVMSISLYYYMQVILMSATQLSMYSRPQLPIPTVAWLLVATSTLGLMLFMSVV